MTDTRSTNTNANSESVTDQVKEAASGAAKGLGLDKSFFDQAQEAVTAAIENTINAAKDNPAAAAAIAAGAAAAVAGAAFGVSKLFAEDGSPKKSPPKKKA